MDHSPIQLKVLKDLIDKMKRLDGDKLKPKEVEVSVESLNPEDDVEGLEGGDAPVLQQATGEAEGGGEGDDLSPEDVTALEQLLGEEKEEV